MAKEEQDTKQQHAQGQHEMCPMLKHYANALVVALAVTPRDEDLDAHGKAHRQGGEDEIIQASHHGRAQFVGAKVTEEGGVGEGDDGLRKVTQHDGIRNAPDFAVGDARCSHAAKIEKSTQNTWFYADYSFCLPQNPQKSLNVFPHRFALPKFLRILRGKLSQPAGIHLQGLFEALDGGLEVVDANAVGDTGLMTSLLGVGIETRGRSQHHHTILIMIVFLKEYQ